MNGKELWRKEFGTRAAGQTSQRQRQQSVAGDRRQACRRVLQERHAGVLRSGGQRECGRRICRSGLARTRCGGTWALRPCWPGGRAIVAVMHEGPSLSGWRSILSQRRQSLGRREREYENPQESDQSYTTPQVVKIDGKDVVVTWGADHLTGHDAATGKLLWECGGFNPDNERLLAGDCFDDRRRRRGGRALRPRASSWRACASAGRATSRSRTVVGQAKAWQRDVPTPVVRDGKAYVLNDTGQIVCLRLEIGRRIVVGRTAEESQQVLCVAGAGGRQAVLCARGRRRSSSAR